MGTPNFSGQRDRRGKGERVSRQRGECQSSNGTLGALQRVVAGPRLTLLLCGDAEGRHTEQVAAAARRWGDLLEVEYLSRSPAPGALADESGAALATLGVTDAAQYLVRPDGYVAFRCGGRDVGALDRYLGEWYTTYR